MSSFASVANFGFIPKYDNLLALSFPQRSSHNLRPFDNGVSYNGTSILADKQYPVQLHGIPFRDIQTLDLYCLVRGYFILLAPDFDNGVNRLTPL